jgi:hypothetical protein
MFKLDEYSHILSSKHDSGGTEDLGTVPWVGWTAKAAIPRARAAVA